jgi:hypothetical protein
VNPTTVIVMAEGHCNPADVDDVAGKDVACHWLIEHAEGVDAGDGKELRLPCGDGAEVNGAEVNGA